MLRRLLPCLIPFLLTFAFGTSAAQAQIPAPESEKSERTAPVLPYFVMTLYTILVLLVVCIPSRKA
jgi:hypothetical protein